MVGSFLRPPELLEARARLAREAISPAEFKRVEDWAVREAISLQRRAGLPVVTDGEQRRESFQSQMTEAVAGFGEIGLDAFLWGDWKGETEVGDREIERPPDLGVRNKLRRRRHLTVEEFVFARAATDTADTTVKVTLPSPSLFANLWSEEVPGGAYPTLDEFLEDVAGILREEVVELARLGAGYIQLDAPHYPLLVDPGTRAFYEERGWDLERWLSKGVELDNYVIGGREEVPGSDVTFAFHLCRGNQGSRWLVSGSYEPIARRIFAGVAAERLMLEYDDERSGGFEPLTHVPDDKVAVLGLVTTKSPRPESPAYLGGLVKEAQSFVDLERLAISPQCGFSTSTLGNAVTADDEERKLATLVEAAAGIW